MYLLTGDQRIIKIEFTRCFCRVYPCKNTACKIVVAWKINPGLVILICSYFIHKYLVKKALTSSTVDFSFFHLYYNNNMCWQTVNCRKEVRKEKDPKQNKTKKVVPPDTKHTASHSWSKSRGRGRGRGQDFQQPRKRAEDFTRERELARKTESEMQRKKQNQKNFEGMFTLYFSVKT